MEFGVGYFPTHDGIGPGPVARLVEEHGQESLLFAEHSHIPASRLSPFPGGGPIPRKYLHTYDLFVALTAAAAATSRLRVGSGICLIIQRDPILVGGHGPKVLDRVLAFGDAWLPNYEPGPAFLGRIAELQSRAERPVGVQVLGMPIDAKAIESMEQAGVQRVLPWLPTGGRAVVERALEQWESAISEFNGA